jgi:hypothetical protein
MENSKETSLARVSQRADARKRSQRERKRKRGEEPGQY